MKKERKERFEYETAYLGKYSVERNGRGQAPISYTITDYIRLNPLDLQPQNFSRMTFYMKIKTGELKTTRTRTRNRHLISLNELYNHLRKNGVKTQAEVEAETGERIKRTKETLPKWLTIRARQSTYQRSETEEQAAERILAEIEAYKKEIATNE